MFFAYYTSNKKEMQMTKRGFTIIELMVVITILGIIFGMSIPIFNNRQAKFNANYSNIVDKLNMARQRAISTGENIMVAINDTSIATGTSDPLIFYHGIEIENAGTIPDTVFFQPDGSPDNLTSSVGEIIVSGLGYTRYIYITASGYIISE